MLKETDTDSLTRDEAERIMRRLAGASSAGPPGDRSSAPARTEDRLKEAQARYRTLVEQIPAVTFMASLDDGVNELYVSPQIEALLGYSQKEWLEDPVLWYTRLHPDDRVRWHEEFARTCAHGEHFRSEYRFVSRAGAVVWIHGEAQMVRDAEGRPLFLQGVAFDVTAQKQAEEALRTSRDELERQVRQRTAELAREVAQHQQANERLTAALKEKELLLKEIHHRVKNNLQIISSLLSLQAGQLTDPAAAQVFRESQNRVRSMALIHEKLYQAKDLATIPVAAYINDLTASLFRSYGGAARGVRLHIDVRDATFDLDVAIPCGLMINELISNSLKHAFPGRAGGTIRIALTPGPDSTYSLVVGDDGVGFPEGLDVRNAPSLGLQLVLTLADQLNGAVEFRNNGGAESVVTFRPAANGGTVRP